MLETIEDIKHDQKELEDLFNKFNLKFDGIKVEIPVIKVAQNYEDVKSIFRQANT